MSIEVGEILEGKVTGVTKFGAFVSLPSGDDGLVHISEISNDYVEKVEDYVSRGEEVKVKVISVKDGKISLSMKQLEEKKRPQPREERSSRPSRPAPSPDFTDSPREVSFDNRQRKDSSFEDMMNQFLKVSSERHSDLKDRDGKKTGHRGR